jgi:acetate kinase
VVEGAPLEDIALCLNAGSSSLKFALFRVTDQAEESLAMGAIEHLGSLSARATLTAGEHRAERACAHADMADALNAAFQLLDEQGLPAPTLVGHRVVHGGQAHHCPTRVDAQLVASLKTLIPLAPLHLPGGISGIEAALARLPKVPHVACFDTAFHAEMPEHAARFALPSRLYDEGVRRYGFHGLSYEYILSGLGDPAPPRLIVAHLGNGASLAAIRAGKSVDTTMSFTPGGGIPMGTRSGDLDPGLILYLLREKGYTPSTLEDLLERKSGLLGVAGSADMRELVQRQADDPLARLAIVIMGYAVRKTIGAYMAVLGGLDLLVFTGGIGEHTPAIREQACRGLSAFGVVLDQARNDQNLPQIHADSSACRILVMATDEDRMIARHTRALLRGGSKS